jgi:hypothetical protein
VYEDAADHILHDRGLRGRDAQVSAHEEHVDGSGDALADLVFGVVEPLQQYHIEILQLL